MFFIRHDRGVRSFPLAFLAAENAIRAVPELIFAIAIMLPVFGLGPLAGRISSVGSLGKLTTPR
ncbi:MAG TPA: hypothetical protein VFZ63_20005 [Jiangellaceae bacterium]